MINLFYSALGETASSPGMKGAKNRRREEIEKSDRIKSDSVQKYM